jgi:hypothetical protein
MMKRSLFWIICPLFLMTSLLTVGSIQPARAQAGAGTPTPTPLAEIPPGFRLIDSALGVQLYRKDYANGNPDFVQVIDIGQGARIELLHGQITEARPEKGAFGGPDPRMTSPPLQTYWQQIQSEDKYAFCVTNGTFFYMPEYPTRLAFPLKVAGQIITEGWGVDTYIDQKLILELWQDRVEIEDLSEQALYSSDAPDILGGLTEQANKRAKFAVGRTFIGLDDRDSDGEQETVLILNTRTALQSSAAAVLRDFGADQVMMLDGGGSTQLLCKSGWHINSDRPIPQALAVIAAKPPPVAMQVLEQPEWPVLVPGEAFPFVLEIRNSGIVSWTQQTTQLEVDPGMLGIVRWMPLEGQVDPGERVVFTDTLASLYQPGLYTVQIDWQIVHDNKAYPGQSLETHAIVLPEELADQRSELENALQDWKSASPEQIQEKIETWVEERSGSGLPTVEALAPGPPAAAGEAIRPLDSILIPLLMLPIVIIMGFILTRRNADQ